MQIKEDERNPCVPGSQLALYTLDFDRALFTKLELGYKVETETYKNDALIKEDGLNPFVLVARAASWLSTLYIDRVLFLNWNEVMKHLNNKGQD